MFKDKDLKTSILRTAKALNRLEKQQRYLKGEIYKYHYKNN